MQIFSPVTRTDLQAHAQSLKLWLLEIAVWLVEAIGFREGRIALNGMRLEARRELRQLIFMMMCARMRFRKTEQRRRWMRPPSTPRGFRYAQRRIDMVRLYTRGIALKSFAQMRRVLDDLDAVVKRAIARVPKSVSTGRLTICVAPTPVSGFTAPTPAAEGADTS
ncbi:MAG: hypothetical protein IV086_08345 [Hyphomonadaceae bacterium]|nr:MAG: hypothetical protein FD160_612 [Caulobacteraceae bacterium]MBT9445692.1 hypothetical protein [Hyphomonadaceae bacterium]TPW08339.1 MAG: hypothetical protein FD124_478 [Alphaproteobacteria bacterium]